MTKSFAFSCTLLLACFGAGPVPAAVVESTAGGFQVESTFEVAAEPGRVYDALTAEIAGWWDAAHSWSGDAANFSVDTSPGGCFCERLPSGGGVRHMTVVFADPGKMLRWTGALGPLQELGVAGSMTWSFAPSEVGTTLELSYTVGGYRPGGLADWAVPVDGVLAGQLERLKRYVETGRPTEE